jgi:hypothetical protein
MLRMTIKYINNSILNKLKIDRNCKKSKHKEIRIRKFNEEEI